MPGPLVTDELPPELPRGADNGDRAYYRRRIDELMDGRLKGIEGAVNSLDARSDAIDAKLDRIFGALALLTVLASLFGAAVVRWVTGS